jgi:hypothetical protein
VRAYEGERLVFKRRCTPLSMQETRDLADKLFAHFGVEPIHVMRTRRQHPHWKARSWYWPGHGAKLPRLAIDLDASDWVVCHEVAHYVSDVRKCDRGHGRAWAAIYVEAVRVAMPGTRYGDRLEAGYRKLGLLR